MGLSKETSQRRVLLRLEISCAFAKLKSHLSHRVALKLPNPDKPVLLETVARSVAGSEMLKEKEEAKSSSHSALASLSILRNVTTQRTRDSNLKS